MGRRGPQPRGIAGDGLLAKVMETVTKNHHRTYTGPELTEALKTKSPSIGMYLCRLARAGMIHRVRQGVYRGIEPEPQPTLIQRVKRIFQC